MPQTHAQEHALSHQHAGRNPRLTGAPANIDDTESSGVSRASVRPDTASDTQEAGTVRQSAGEAGKPTPHGSEHEARDPATESDLEHPQPAHHNDNEKSRLPERDDAGRKQAPNDRPGRKSGEGETPVG